MKRWIWAGAAVVLIVGLWLTISKDRQIRTLAQERESYFLSLECVAVSAMNDMEQAKDDRELGLDGMYEFALLDREIEFWMKPFPKGLDFRVNRRGYVIEEPKVSKVSMFSEDRLVASDKEPAHWERSGKRATKP